VSAVVSMVFAVRVCVGGVCCAMLDC